MLNPIQKLSSSIKLLIVGAIAIGIFDSYKYFFLSQLGIASKEPFATMARSRDPKIIKEYLDRGFDLNARNDDGYTLLNMAVYAYKQDSNEVVDLLIERDILSGIYA